MEGDIMAQLVSTEFRDQVLEYLQRWASAPPARETYLNAARDMADWRARHHDSGLWRVSPLMVTATIDDGWGHGLEVIEKLAEALGITVHPLGVLQSPETIIGTCKQLHPALLGVTVLQFDSDDSVAEIVRGVPAMTRLVAGGAAYQYDPDFAVRTGTHVVIKNGASFLEYLVANAASFEMAV